MLINNTPVDTYDLCTSANTGGWVEHVVNLNAYAGQSVTLQIRTETDGSNISNLFVDDVVFPPAIVVPHDELEVTQGIQQPNNSVRLIAQRPTYVRWTLTSPTLDTNVSGYLIATRDGATLAGSPLAASNNPRTLKNTANRAVLNDTFNFQVPADWADGTVNLSAYAANASGFLTTTSAQPFNFTPSAALPVKVVPIEYHCTSGGTGTTTPSGPYDYLVDYTFRTYPVPSIALSTHAPVPYYGRCNSSGVPLPWLAADPNNFTAWSGMLYA